MIILLLAQVLYVGNQACADCHAEIFKAYRQTPMAQSSGVVTGGLTPGSFVQGDSKITYRINDAGTVTVVTPTQLLERKLDYFIGSGAAGRSFLYTRNGFLFQAPVTWYAQQARWDASPGYEQDHVSRWNRPIAADCLNCHSSQVRSAPGFANRYADPPFAQTGIGCERCHGPGSEHIRGRGSAQGPAASRHSAKEPARSSGSVLESGPVVRGFLDSMVNPAKLDPARRDSVCAQCHMSGEARVARVGRRFEEYRPGALLADYAAYFVFQGAPPLKATSYVEKLAASRCKAVSGDRMWCGTCHDPHRTPAAAERVAWYRTRCLICHQQAQCRRGSDCVACHMPRGRVVGGGHGVLTDHSIPRTASHPESEPGDVWKLQPFSAADAGPRELGLAYAEISARTGDRRQIREAIRLLSGTAHDPDADLRLADLYQRSGDSQQAALLYRSVLNKQPGSLVALVNLGNAYAAAGQLEQAIKLWQEALRRQPCQTEAAQNLRTAYQATKQTGQILELKRAQAGCVVE